MPYIPLYAQKIKHPYHNSYWDSISTGLWVHFLNLQESHRSAGKTSDSQWVSDVPEAVAAICRDKIDEPSSSLKDWPLGNRVGFFNRLLCRALPDTDVTLRFAGFIVSEAEIETAKQYPLDELLGSKGKRIGRMISYNCPFHSDKTPSFTVYPDNRWYCYSCGRFGDSIAFLRLSSGKGFVQAVQALQGGLR